MVWRVLKKLQKNIDRIFVYLNFRIYFIENYLWEMEPIVDFPSFLANPATDCLYWGCRFLGQKSDFPDTFFGHSSLSGQVKKQVKITERTNIHYFYRILLWISLIEILSINFFLKGAWSNMPDTFGFQKKVFFVKKLTKIYEDEICTSF